MFAYVNIPKVKNVDGKSIVLEVDCSQKKKRYITVSFNDKGGLAR